MGEAELQALYARPIGPYFNLQAGLRYDIEPNPSRGYAVFGIEGLVPYWFEVGGALFVSNKGDVHARVEGYYDLHVTQRLVLRPVRAGDQAMIAAVIRWSACRVVLVGLLAFAFAAAGVYAVSRIPLDAIPDLSDTQVIIYTEYPGQAPQVVEDQVAYPLTSALLSVPQTKAVRGLSFFGVSFVYVIFEDGVDIYWARSRTLECLNSAAQRLPAGIVPALGPDASGVGWVYQYAVVGAQQSLADLRTLQDWYVRYALAKAPGVAEVASVGGFVRQYQVIVYPRRLQTYGVALPEIQAAIRASSSEVGARSIEMANTEYMIRGRGYVTSPVDLEQVVIRASSGTPLLLGDVAQVIMGPDERRGLTEMNGEGEAVSGIVMQRYGADALDVIANVKARIAELAPSLPKDVQIVPVYDRSELIGRAIDTLKRVLVEESIIVALVSLLFLFHFRSALAAIVMLPVGVLMAFIPMEVLGISSNIMSLGGIAIAIGAMVDAAIVMIENAHKHLEREDGASRREAIVAAAVEVGPSLFFSLLIITGSFLPIFTLEDQEGRFNPLARIRREEIKKMRLWADTHAISASIIKRAPTIMRLPRNSLAGERSPSWARKLPFGGKPIVT